MLEPRAQKNSKAHLRKLRLHADQNPKQIKSGYMSRTGNVLYGRPARSPPTQNPDQGCAPIPR